MPRQEFLNTEKNCNTFLKCLVTFSTVSGFSFLLVLHMFLLVLELETVCG